MVGERLVLFKRSIWRLLTNRIECVTLVLMVCNLTRAGLFMEVLVSTKWFV